MASRKQSRWVQRLLLGLILSLLSGSAGILGIYAYYDRGLPSVEALRTYRPPQGTKVYCSDHALCAEFYQERRTWADVASLPAYVKNAFVAAEDADFYHHEGLDYWGMVRAGLKLFKPGARAQGASTITQQACKNILLSHERKLSRKIREWILAPRLERALGKDQILALYLNQIYFGHLRYGIEEASLYYFGKHARDLSLGEAATLGGIPQSPDRINPATNMAKAKERQRYVLAQMDKHRLASSNLIKAEWDRPIVLSPQPKAAPGAYYTEEVRRTLVDHFGETTVLTGGLRVDIAMDPVLQEAADTALAQRLEGIDRQMGYRGPLGKLSLTQFKSVKNLVEKRIREAGKRKATGILVADLSALTQPLSGTGRADDESAGGESDDESSSDPLRQRSQDEEQAGRASLKPLEPNLKLTGYILKVDDQKKIAEVDLVGQVAQMSFATLGWARPYASGKWSPLPSKLSDVVQVGELVRVRVLPRDARAALEVTLDQIPRVQGALVAIEPSQRHLVALVGGYDIRLSSYNRATQAKRQPGSSFKPFLYAAALESQRFTSVSILNDAPEAVRDPYTGKVWKPQNYEKTGFEGPMSIRQALTYSKNTISVRLMEAMTPAVAIDFARRAGIHSELPNNLTLALGTGEVSVLEMANAYATLASLGKFADPVMILKVTDPEGKVLEEHTALFEEKIQPQVAYLITSLMRSVVEQGTAVAVKSLNRPAAGKTGTASEYRDAWFSGYTPDYVATAWVGYDNHDSLGPGETGARAALPIWLDWMKAAHRNLPVRDFSAPAGIEFVQIDPTSGLRSAPAGTGHLEPFLEGTAPRVEAPSAGQVDPNRFFIEDGAKSPL